jgi:hypothetical protein
MGGPQSAPIGTHPEAKLRDSSISCGSLSVGSRLSAETYTVLQELLEHHIDEEEGEFFKIARKNFERHDLKMSTGIGEEY